MKSPVQPIFARVTNGHQSAMLWECSKLRTPQKKQARQESA